MVGVARCVLVIALRVTCVSHHADKGAEAPLSKLVAVEISCPLSQEFKF